MNRRFFQDLLLKQKKNPIPKVCDGLVVDFFGFREKLVVVGSVPLLTSRSLTHTLSLTDR